MSTVELLRRLHDSDVRLFVQDGRLRVNAGRGVLDEALLAELRAHRDALIALLAAGDTAEPSFPRVERTPAMACAPAQRQLWLQQQLAGASAAYNLPVALRLRGALDVAALRDSLAAIVERHEILRTGFIAVDGEPCQRIVDAGAFALPVEDADAASLPLHLAAQSRRVFDLANGPLFEGRLLRLAADEHVLLLNMHHLVSDGWSLGVLMNELGQGYAARRAHGAAAAPLPMQYADYAAWQHARSGGAEHAARVGYWRQALDGAPAVMTLPCDRVRPARQSHGGAAETVAFGPGLALRLSELARGESASLFMLLLAAFKVLLARLSGQDDLVVGTPVANRPHAALESLIGYFVNIVPLRSRVDDDAPFRELLRGVRDGALAAFAQQELPFDQIVDALNPPRSAAHAPLFQVMFALQNAPAELPALAGVEASLVVAPRRHAKFDLSLSLEQTDAGLVGELEYATDLFDAATIRAWLADYAAILAGIAEAPDAAVADLGFGDTEERARRLALFRGATERADALELAPAAVRRQAQQRPCAAAVEAPDAHLDYATLDARAERLAAELRRRGVTAENRVGICLPRSADFVVAALAVWKAGAAYVALDTHYPPARLRYIGADADLRCVLGAAPTLALCQSLELPLLRVDALPEGPPAPAMTPCRLHPEQLAYVVYTSGSTGNPKGAMVSHGALRNMLLWYRRMTGIAATDRSSQLAQLGFDGSMMDIWGSLTVGACLCIPDEASREQPQRLAAWLETARISVAYVPTPLAEALLTADGAPPTNLRQLLTGGERLKRRAPADAGFVLQNAYGPSEAAVVTLAGTVAPAPAPITIGRPIVNTRAYVLDAQLRPVGNGVAGELYLAGPSLGRGYVDRPGLTAERFLPDPFAAQPGERMYRTGDRVRCLANGDYEFLGRVDRQVKLRGFRIELGEIESALCRLDDVRAAVVELRETPAGDAALVAYVVPGSPATTADTLRDALRQNLPAFQLPAAWLLLAELPLTAGGKVDRRALPAPVWSDERPRVAPRDALETAIAALYGDVLGRAVVGVHDDFFALGGHSLSAMKLLARLQAQYGIELPLAAVFEAPNVAALAQRLRPRLGAASPAQAIPTVARNAALPLSFAQQRLWFLAQLEPATTAYHMPLVVRLRGALDVAALATAFDQLVRRHECLRARFVENDGEPAQWFDRVPEPLQVDGIAAAALDATLAAFLALPFDLCADAPLRARLLRVDDGSHVLAIVVHHIVADGASVALFARELAEAYRACGRGAVPSLPPLRLQYGDYAAWQRSRDGDMAARAQLDWWMRRLADTPATLDLPLDRPRRAHAVPAAAQIVAVSLDANRVVALRAVAQRQGATLFMTLLAAFKLQLSRLSGQSDICVGTPMSERGRAGLEQVFGLFLGTLALRTQLPRDASFTQWLACVRQTALDAYAHQDVPFERIVDALRIERDLSRHPLFQVFFNMPGEDAAAALALPGIEIETLPPPPQPAKFDLTLYAYERDGRVELQLHYDARLFDAIRAQDLLDQLHGLLAQIAADPDRPVAAYTLRTAMAARALPDPMQPLDRRWRGSIAERFRHCAIAYPQRDAVCDARRRLTYGELDRASNRLGALLRAQGVGPGDIVALHATRRLELVVALLGVIKSGAAFMLLDAAYPDARLLACVEAARPAAWMAIGDARVCAPELDAALAGLRWRGVLEDHERDLAGWPGAALPLPAVDADSLSHIAFTSGSTGRPKVIAGRHGPFTHFLPWLQQRFGLDENDRYSMLSGLSHDPLQRDILLPLMTGAAVCVPDAEQLVPGQLARWMREQRITVANLTPAMAGVLADVPAGSAPLDELRRAFVVGDAFPRADVQRLSRQCPQCEIVSFYGATETQWALGHQVADATPDAPAAVPLGLGFPGVQLLLLDAADQPAGIGEVAEICIRSAHIARGYLAADADGAARFGLNPVTADAQDRLYRTGDLGRYAPDGTVQGLGRADRQVSLRGVRIELGDVEAALRRLPGVRQAVVLHLPDAQRLAGFVVIDGAELPPHWRAALRHWLPDALLPSTLTALDRLPLTPNGKLDRAALLAAGMAPAPVPASPVVPATPTEHRVAAIVGTVLGCDGVDAEADFFAIGGNSLSAMRVVARLRDIARRPVPVRQLFETPTVAALARWLDAQDGAPADDSPTAWAADEAPLSSAQQRLWFLQQLDTASAAYNMLLALRLHGDLDIAALEAAFADLCVRQASLRTGFRERDGRASQHVLPVRDAFALQREICAAAEFDERLRAFAALPFDLSAPPLRACLFRFAPDEHALALSLHHIVSDGWSMGVLARELADCYRARRRGGAAALPPLACRYVDYAAWQRDRVQGAARERQARFWREYLHDLPPLLPLPTDRPRPPQQSLAGASVALEIDAALTRRLRTFCRDEGVTPFMLLMAVYQVLLARYSGSDDITVGFPTANRQRPEFESLIGLFADTRVLRTRPRALTRFRTYLQQVRDSALAIDGHADLPFEAIVDLLQPQRSLAHAPLFQVMFTLQNFDALHIELPGLTVHALPHPPQAARFDLTLVLREGDTFRGSLEYATDLFDAATAHRMGAHFVSLLQAAIAHPETPLLRLPLPVPEPPSPARPPHDGASVIAQFERHAAAAPHATAVIDACGSLEYASLNAAANRLAHHLLRGGIEAEDRVGLLLPRGASGVTALLAVLKCGGAYVPLDPASPADRLRHAIADAHLRTVLTTTALQRCLPAGTARICVDAIDLATEPVTNPRRPLAPSQLAYAIFTSGTTGRPKPVLLQHGGLANLAAAQARLHDITAASRVLQLVSGAFDVATGDIALALTQGAALVIAPEAARSDAATLRALLREQRISHLQIPVALLAHLDPDGLPDLRVVVAGGEEMPASVRRRWCETVRLHNAYGPTETTVMASGGAQGGDGAIDIGLPLAGVRIHVLDAALQPQPVGVYGEIHIAGAGVGRGYLGHAGLTAERFLPEAGPGAEPGARMYRSGDVGRWRNDGRLEIRGRVDHQIKLRGYRIEPGEVEAALREQAGIADAAVIARADAPGQRRLVAYLVPAAGMQPDTAAIAAALRTRLMDYLVPSAWVVLDALPLTANGKLDRTALPPPGSAASVAESTDVAAIAPAAAVLAAIWCRLLGLAAVGAHDSFFALGGDSLLSIQVVAAAAQAGWKITPKQVFECQTLARLAPLALPLGGSDAEQGAVTGELPMTPIQHWFFEGVTVSPQHWNQSVLLQPQAGVTYEHVAAAIARLQSHHDLLRLRVLAGEDACRLELAAGDALSPLRRATVAAGDTAFAAALTQQAERLQGGFRFDGSPLFAAVWFESADGAQRRLWLLAHHLLVDAVSWRILLEDLQTLVRQTQAGQPLSLPPKTASYRRFASNLRHEAVIAELARESAYWSAQVPPRAPRLPLNAAGSAREDTADKITLTLPPAQTASLLRRQAGGVNDVLLAALALAWRAWTGDDVVSLALEGHGRDAPLLDLDVSRTVGWFTINHPLLLTLPEAAGAAHALHCVRQQLAAVPGRGAGYGLLRQSGLLDAGWSPPVSFNYLGQFDQAVSADGPFAVAAEATGHPRAAEQPRLHEVDLVGLVVQGSFSLDIRYGRERLTRASMQAFADAYRAALETLLALADEPTEALRPADPATAARLALVALQPNGRRAPLFCVHPAGGSVACYRALAEALGEDQPLYGLQAPALAGADLRLTSFEAMAAFYIAALRRRQPRGPYRLLGWSQGGTIAFEIARQLVQAGERVALLALVDPGYSKAMLRTDDTAEDAPPDGIDAASYRRLRDMQRDIAAAAIAYAPRRYDGDVLLFQAEDAALFGHLGPGLGWDPALADWHLLTTPGGHYTCLQPPQVAAFAAALETRLAASAEVSS